MNLEPRSRNPYAGVDFVPAILALILSAIGLALINSAVSPSGEAGRVFVYRQSAWLSLAVAGTALFVLFDHRRVENWTLAVYLISLGALVAVWALGKATAGSRRWIEIGFMRFQPSEFVKITTVLVLAKYYADRGSDDRTARDLLRPLFYTAAPVILVLVQPDLGTAIMISLIAGSVILCAGIGRNGWKWIAGAAIPIITTLAFFGDKLLLDYQKKRILTYLYPEHDPLGAGYHILQSQIAIGSGGFWGKGYLQGPQNQLMFLPVKHTDFIFSVLAEEWGFIGCLVVFMLFSALILRGLSVSARAPTRFGALAAFGCTAILFWHVVMNTGMVMGLLPVVGVPLSFLSYGGSSLMLSYTCVAILCSAPTRRS